MFSHSCINYTCTYHQNICNTKDSTIPMISQGCSDLETVVRRTVLAASSPLKSFNQKEDKHSAYSQRWRHWWKWWFYWVHQVLHPVASEEVIQTALNPQRWAVPGQQGLSLGTSEHALLERSSVFGWRQYNLIQLVGKEKPRVRCRSHGPTFSFRERWVGLSTVLCIWHPQTHFFLAWSSERGNLHILQNATTTTHPSPRAIPTNALHQLPSTSTKIPPIHWRLSRQLKF